MKNIMIKILDEGLVMRNIELNDEILFQFVKNVDTGGKLESIGADYIVNATTFRNTAAGDPYFDTVYSGMEAAIDAVFNPPVGP